MRGGRVAVVGGSIAGCAAALAAWRAGATEVVVFERSAERLQDRGVGLVLHNDRYAELEAAGHLDAGMPWLPMERRPWIVRDGEDRAGRTVGALEFPFRAYGWSSLWSGLRDRLPDAVDHRTGTAVTEVLPEPDGARVRLADGTEERFDLVVGADGYRSTVRSAMYPGLEAEYGGYVAWRGTLPAADLPGPAGAFPERDAPTIVYPGGHMIIYRIPGATGVDVNWVLYATPPGAADTPPGRELTDELREFQQDLMDRHFPPFWRETVRRTPAEAAFVQPIYDLAVEHVARGRLVLLGDAAAIARPHTGSGAIKALQDAAVLEEALRPDGGLDAALAAYDAKRAPVGKAILGLGRSLGRALVQQTPDWAALDQAALDAWWSTTGGQTGGVALLSPGRR
ncbi:FAD-dependent monooxygenase [Kitasatospora terrestris]|uniref:FAD binding domain-containing protein n=1 Tax=Kitasatospora terrestris TaxID=258051 RepID=A0ABP9E6J7_9ACTN